MNITSKPFMLSKSNKMIILPLTEQGIITHTIPHALVCKGYIAVPHETHETKILNNMGYLVPSPIYFFYNWPNSQNYTPYQAQVETAAFLTNNRNAFVLNGIGTGKTLAALWALHHMIGEGSISKILIISPLSTLKLVWGNALWLNFQDLKYTIIRGTPTKRKALLAEDSDIYIINPDGAKIMWEEFLERKDIDHIIVDEIAEYRNATTDKYKALRKLVQAGKTIWGLTATPTPNAPTDAWAQIQLISPQNTTRYFGGFRQITMRKVSDYKWVPLPDALQTVHAVMQPAIRFSRDECYDLPEASHIDLEVELSKEQKSAYKEMKDSLITQYAEGEILAVNEAVKMSKLIQISAGVVYDVEGKAHVLPCQGRLQEMISNIRRAGTKVIVFVPFTNMLRLVHKEVSKHWTAAIVDGSVSSTARDKIFSAFQAEPNPHVLIAHPKCMAHGLTLTEASMIIWYAPYPNTDICTQANGRIRRNPQKNNQLYIYLQGTEIERRVYEKIRNNQALQGTLLEMFE